MTYTGRLIRSGAPTLHVRRAVDEPHTIRDNPDMMQRLHDAEGAVNSGGIAALLGNRGSGKTQVAVCIMANYLATERGSVRYTTACEMFQFITETYGGKQSTTWATDAFMRPALLVIDDCHERRDTQNEDQILTQIIDHRYRHERGTLLISNQRPDAFTRSMGPSITSRIWERGVVIQLPDVDFRWCLKVT